MSKICIVIPCYNEGDRFQMTAFQDFYDKNEMIYFCMVNDGSQDHTEQMLTTIADKNIRVKTLSLPQNKGKAEAVRQGMLASLEWDDFSAIGYFDADMATPFTEVHLLYRHLVESGESCVLSLGSRIKRLGAQVERNALRHYVGRVFSTAASIVLGLPVYDTQCGAKLFRPEVIQVLFEKSFISAWLFDVEIFARLTNFYGGKKQIQQHVIEVPLTQWEEKGGSRIKITHLLKVPFELWKIRRTYSKK